MHPSQIYSKLLSDKERGHPLWLTTLNDNLPLGIREQGLRIGDVGVLTPYGGFDVLFNACAPADDPMNLNRVPRYFMDLQLDEGDVVRKPSIWSPGAVITSVGCENLAEGLTPDCDEGAFLMLPLGASREDVVNVKKLRSHATTNARAFYEFARNSCGREAQEGSLLFVTGCDKTKSWKLGVFTQPLKGGLDDRDGSIQTRLGPTPASETENQCVFFRAFVIRTVEQGREDEVAQSTLHKPAYVRVAIKGLPVTKCSEWSDIYKVAIPELPFPLSAIKVLRRRPSASEIMKYPKSQVVERYAQLYSSFRAQSSHPNVCSYDVVITDIGDTVSVYAIVTPWFPNGNVLEFLRNKRETTNIFSIVLDIAKGIEHIHQLGVVHGDIHGGNILIKDDGEACITDFGISALSRQLYPDAESHPNMREHPPNLGNSFLSRFERHGEFTGINKLITMFGDTERPTRDSHQPIPTHWMFKPREELVLTESATTFTQAMDVYSFACTVYSMYTEHSLVSSLGRDPDEGIKTILKSGHSSLHRPPGMCNALWILLKRCWHNDPPRRPSMKEVVEHLQQISDRPSPEKGNRFSQALRQLYVPLIKVTSLRFALG